MTETFNGKLRAAVALALSAASLIGSGAVAYSVLRSDIATNRTNISHAKEDRAHLRREVLDGLKRIETEQAIQRADLKELLQRKDMR